MVGEPPAGDWHPPGRAMLLIDWPPFTGAKTRHAAQATTPAALFVPYASPLRSTLPQMLSHRPLEAGADMTRSWKVRRHTEPQGHPRSLAKPVQVWSSPVHQYVAQWITSTKDVSTTCVGAELSMTDTVTV